MATASALTVFLRADSKQFTRSITAARKKVIGFTTDLSKQGISRNIEALTSRIKVFGLQSAFYVGKARKAFLAFKGPVLVATGAVTAGLGVLTAKTKETAAESELWAARLGVTASEMSELGAVARRFGADTEDVADVIKDFSVRVTDAANGNKTYEEVLSMVGLKSKELIKLTPIKQMEAFSDALSKVSRQAQIFALDELVSDPGVRLLPVLSQGSKKLKEFREQVRETGASLSDFDVARIKEGSIEIRKMQETASALGNVITSEISPAIKTFSDVFLGTNKNMNVWRNDVKDAIENVTLGLGALKDGGKILSGTFKGLMALGSGMALQFVLLARAADTYWIIAKNIATLGLADNFSTFTKQLEEMTDTYLDSAIKLSKGSLDDFVSGLSGEAMEQATESLKKNTKEIRENAKARLEAMSGGKAVGVNLLMNPEDVAAESKAVVKESSSLTDKIYANSLKLNESLAGPADKMREQYFGARTELQKFRDELSKLENQPFGLSTSEIEKIMSMKQKELMEASTDPLTDAIDEQNKALLERSKGLREMLKSPTQKFMEAMAPIQELLGKVDESGNLLLSKEEFNMLRQMKEEEFFGDKTDMKMSEFKQADLANIDFSVLGQDQVDAQKKGNKLLEDISKSNKTIAQNMSSGGAKFA